MRKVSLVNSWKYKIGLCSLQKSSSLLESFFNIDFFWDILYLNEYSGILIVIAVQSLSIVWLLVTHGLQHTRLPALHYLLEFAQTLVHWVSDAIQLSHPLFSPSPPAFSLSQHQGIFQWVSCSHQVAQRIGASASLSVLPVNTQDWSPLGWTGWILLAA